MKIKEMRDGEGIGLYEGFEVCCLVLFFFLKFEKYKDI